MVTEAFGSFLGDNLSNNSDIGTFSSLSESTVFLYIENIIILVTAGLVCHDHDEEDKNKDYILMSSAKQMKYECFEVDDKINTYVYCRMPVRRGLQRTARAATRHGARDPLVCPQVDQTYRGAS